MRKGASVQLFLTPPESPVYNIATDDQPAKGDPKALVTIVEFTDYQCPSCAQHHVIFQKLISEFGGRIHFVVRDFPLTQHKQAWKAAEAAEAAREQGKYWEFVALLYARQTALQPDKLKQYASELGLDRGKFDAALDSGKFSEKVERDFQDGQKVGVGGTPSLFINGRNMPDLSYEALKAVIDASLKKPS
jgi:protein-disulfide isomerase